MTLSRANRVRIEALLLRYVGIHSVNPAIDNGPGEGALGRALEEDLRSLDLNVIRQAVHPPDRDNVIARLSGAPGSPELLFEAHLDTVGLSGKAEAHPVVSGNLVHGRGACDTKGSLVAMVEAMRLLAMIPAGQRCSVTLAGTIDEEVAGTGAERLVGTEADYHLAIVGEPTGLELAVAHKGVLRFEIVTHGSPAHSSKPHLGVNAIEAMATVVAAIRDEYAPSLAEIVHPLVGSPTISQSTIRGGTGENVVPAECVLSVDRRVVPGETHRTVLEDIDRVLTAINIPGARIQRREPRLATAALDTPTDHLLVSAMQKARAAVLGNPGQPVGMAYGTDGSFFGPAGIPCVVFGPGSIDQAHSDDEWVGIEETARAAEILARTSMNLV